MERKGVYMREKDKAEDGCYREGLIKNKETRSVILYEMIHCATEIITEPSKSAFNASRRAEREA